MLWGDRMLKRLELDALRADLSAVDANLRGRTDDPIGVLQFEHRKRELEARIADLQREQAGENAGVAIFFGGRPVIGSRGILADFGTQAISNFQSLIATRFAELDGPLGRRGPVPQRGQTQLMITDVARGSVGFVLEEVRDDHQLLDTPLKEVVDEVCSFIRRIASPDEEAFQAVTEIVDDRLLGSLRAFFKLLDDSGATLRVVESDSEFSLGRENVERARRRTDSLRLSETEEIVRGTLYVLPDARKFEIHPVPVGEPIRGSISANTLRELVGDGHEVREGIVGVVQDLRVRIKEARVLDREPRKSFTLIGIGVA